ncbi:MAG TPA: restriction endonuclease [Ilumatobacter sp.]|nr:restriction endonuclease [Ilumatobacter sp.]
MTGTIDLSFESEDSDSDPATRELTPPEWQRYEQDVADLTAKASTDDQPAAVTRNVKVPGALSGTPRQVDVLVEGTMGGEPIRIAAECKHYKRPVGIKTVESFIGMLLDLDVDKGAMYALNGFTDPARKRAAGCRHPRLSLYDIDVARLQPLDYDDLFLEEECPSDGCYAKVYRWWRYEAETGEVLEVGRCDSCGTDVIRCFTCGELIAVGSDLEECFGCQSTYQLDREFDREFDSRDIDYILWRFRDEVFDFTQPQVDTDGERTYVVRSPWS